MSAIDKQALLQQLLQQSEEQRAAQEAAKAERSARLEAMLQERTAASTPVDLSAMAGLADSMAGTKIAPGVAAQAQNQKGFQGRTEELLDQLNTLKGEAVTKTDLPLGSLLSDNADKEGRIARQFGASQQNSMFKEVKRDFDNIRKPLDEIDQQFAGIEDALVSGDYERIKGQLSNFARAVNKEKGVLTDSDVGRTYIDTVDNIYSKFASKFDKGQKINPADVRLLHEAIAAARAKTAEVASIKHQDVVDTYSSNPFGAEVLAAMGDKGLVGGTAKRIGTIGKNAKMADWANKNFGGAATASNGQAPAAPAGGMFGFDPDAVLKARKPQ